MLGGDFFTLENYLKLLHGIPTVNSPKLTGKLADFIVQNVKEILCAEQFNEELVVRIPGLVLDIVKKQAAVKK